MRTPKCLECRKRLYTDDKVKDYLERAYQIYEGEYTNENPPPNQLLDMRGQVIEIAKMIQREHE